MLKRISPFSRIKIFLKFSLILHSSEDETSEYMQIILKIKPILSPFENHKNLDETNKKINK
jgi:hypothetical protein